VKPRLMHRDVDLDVEAPLHPGAETLETDLAVGTLLDRMARGDDCIRTVARCALLTGLADGDAIRYRQRALADCLAHPDVVRDLYALAVEALETKRQARFFWFRETPDAVVQKSVGMLELLRGLLLRLRTVADEHGAGFTSEAFATLFATSQRELDDAYLEAVDRRLDEMRFAGGTLMSATLGKGNRGTAFILRRPRSRGGLIHRLLSPAPAHSFTIPDRDEHGVQALAELRGRGLAHVAGPLGDAVDHLLGFFALLRAELAFYVGCLNLHEDLAARGLATCLPEPQEHGPPGVSATGIYDVSLVFHLPSPVVPNDLDAEGDDLLVITGANQGGKTTFLRGLGLAQLMLQAGMHVAARSFRASLADGVFTHFKREEDPSMTHGKLDEELHRMSEIADLIRPRSLLLLNESFSPTNEREGSEIARQVVRAMLDGGVRVCMVTHLSDLAQGLAGESRPSTLLLRAERLADGRRTFRIVPGEPLPTSHGADSYRRVFGVPAHRDAEKRPGRATNANG
jgi:MutS domain V